MIVSLNDEWDVIARCAVKEELAISMPLIRCTYCGVWMRQR
jgi:hypothetical protein